MKDLDIAMVFMATKTMTLGLLASSTIVEGMKKTILIEQVDMRDLTMVIMASIMATIKGELYLRDLVLTIHL